jgi:hypothetical protein
MELESSVKDQNLPLAGGENKILTWEVLNRKGWEGPGICLLCKHFGEDLNHLFIHCSFLNQYGTRILHKLHINFAWAGNTFIDCWDSWTSNPAVSNRLAAILCWNIWLARNKAIFEDKIPLCLGCVYKILSSFSIVPCKPSSLNTRQRPIFKNDFPLLSSMGLHLQVDSTVVLEDILLLKIR